MSTRSERFPITSIAIIQSIFCFSNSVVLSPALYGAECTCWLSVFPSWIRRRTSLIEARWPSYFLSNSVTILINSLRYSEYSSYIISSPRQSVFEILSDILTAFCRSTCSLWHLGRLKRTAFTVASVLDLLHRVRALRSSFNMYGSSFLACMMHAGALDAEAAILNSGVLTCLAVKFAT